MLGRLKIEQICATTPQAKGRVERANQTLQDRLVKELRLAGISDMASAQAFLPGFIARYNAQFAVEPRAAEDAHRRWEDGAEALDAALARHDERCLSKALTCGRGGALHQDARCGHGARGARVTVRHYLDGRMDVVFKDRVLPYTTVRKLPQAAAVEDDKTLDARLDAILARHRQEPPRREHAARQGLG